MRVGPQDGRGVLVSDFGSGRVNWRWRKRRGKVSKGGEEKISVNKVSNS